MENRKPRVFIDSEETDSKHIAIKNITQKEFGEGEYELTFIDSNSYKKINPITRHETQRIASRRCNNLYLHVLRLHGPEIAKESFFVTIQKGVHLSFNPNKVHGNNQYIAVLLFSLATKKGNDLIEIFNSKPIVLDGLIAKNFLNSKEKTGLYKIYQQVYPRLGDKKLYEYVKDEPEQLWFEGESNPVIKNLFAEKKLMLLSAH